MSLHFSVFTLSPGGTESVSMLQKQQRESRNINTAHFYILVPSVGKVAQSAFNNPFLIVTTPRVGDGSITVWPWQVGKSRHDTPPFRFPVGFRKSLGARPRRAPSLLRGAGDSPALRAAGEQPAPPQPRIRLRPAAPARSPSREGPAGQGLPVPPVLSPSPPRVPDVPRAPAARPAGRCGQMLPWRPAGGAPALPEVSCRALRPPGAGAQGVAAGGGPGGRGSRERGRPGSRTESERGEPGAAGRSGTRRAGPGRRAAPGPRGARTRRLGARAGAMAPRVPAAAAADSAQSAGRAGGAA